MSGKDGYLFILLQNGRRDAIYKEKCTFTTFVGLQLLSPHAGNSYEAEVHPVEEGMILIKIG